MKSKLRSHNTSYCLIEVVTKAGLTGWEKISRFMDLFLRLKHYITYVGIVSVKIKLSFIQTKDE